MSTSLPGAQAASAHDNQLLRAYHEGGDRAARERLIERHLPLVRRLAWRYRTTGEPHDDLVQSGCLGLVEAVDRFELSRGTDFLAYAVPTVLGEIRRHLRDRGDAVYAPRSLKQLAVGIRRATDDLIASLGRSPTLRELAAYLEVDTERVVEAMVVLDVQRTLPLDDGLDSESGESLSYAEIIGAIDGGYAMVEERAAAAAGLGALDGRERTIVALSLVVGLPQSQIAARIGISQMQVSRLLRRALAKARAATERPSPLRGSILAEINS